ncbi:MAG TPA: alpha/beta hydrolase [Candidatus Limnocylindrales bacterium]|nr:alpha/beta hydrolase [Candidatus Limnocylindrales bacterium]
MPRLQLANGLYLGYQIIDFVDPWQPHETVLLHHGLAKFGTYWMPWYRILARHFRVVTLDMLGNGASSKPRGHTWGLEGYAADAQELLAALDIDRVHFVGEGLGGCVGIQWAATKPDRIATLTLASTPYRPARGNVSLADTSKEVARQGLDYWIDKSVANRMRWSERPPEEYAWYRAQRAKTSPRILAEQMAAQATVDLEPLLPRVQAPTLLIVPGQSHVDAHDQMIRMGEAIPRSTVVEFPDEGQWVTFARPDECVAAFLDFVAAAQQA